MIGRATSFLGLAFSDRGIACAEVAVNGDRRSVRRTATLTFTTELSLEKPDALGAALAAFLREKKFGASRVVAGMPARWLIASEKDIPPANETQARSALQMQAERMGATDGSDIVFDYAGKPNPAAASRVLLVGIVRTQFERVQRVLDVAGLGVLGITSTGLAMIGNVKPADRDTAMLLVNAGGAEMVVRQGGSSRTLRHVSMTGNGTPAMGALGAEIRRAVTMSALNGSSSREMLLLDGVGLAPDQINELSTRSGMQMRGGEEMKLLGLSPDAATVAQTASGESQPAGYFTPAVSLALAASHSDRLAIDFSHSRLAAAKKQRLGRNAIIGIAAAFLAIIGIVMLYMQVRKAQGEVDDINAQIAQMAERSKPAQILVDRVNFARGYYDLRPTGLEALRLLTGSFKDDEKIWVTSFSVRDNGTGVLQGKAADNETILKMVERLKKLPRFSAVEKLDTHPADTRSQEWQFSLNFTFNLAG